MLASTHGDVQGDVQFIEVSDGPEFRTNLHQALRDGLTAQIGDVQAESFMLSRLPSAPATPVSLGQHVVTGAYVIQELGVGMQVARQEEGDC